MGVNPFFFLRPLVGEGDVLLLGARRRQLLAVSGGDCPPLSDVRIVSYPFLLSPLSPMMWAALGGIKGCEGYTLVYIFCQLNAIGGG